MTDDLLAFNGVDVATGRYLFPPMSLANLAASFRTASLDDRHAAALQQRCAEDEDHLGVMWGTDADRLDSAGWALAVAADTDPAVLDALEPLRRLRQEHAGDRYRELVVQACEDADAFLRRHGMAPGPADPRKLPYYVLIVGGPEAIPFSFQYQLDVEYAVGRIDFDSIEAYANYARTVVTAETTSPAPAQVAQKVHLFGTRNPGDTATALSASRLVVPLGHELTELSAELTVTQDVGESASRDRLLELLLMADSPPVLFTASHGLGGSGPDQREAQGALLCQEWPGPLQRMGRIDESHYVAGHHIPGNRAVGPQVVFSFCCYGAGTPQVSDFGAGQALTDSSFVARLPQRLLGAAAGGCLAFIGHVDRAFSCSFLWKGLDPQITSLASTMLGILHGMRVGAATEYLNSRYAAIATQLTARLQANQRSGKLIDDRTLAALWTANHDARNYLILGDPAVRVASPS